jgi:hypothetical protein
VLLEQTQIASDYSSNFDGVPYVNAARWKFQRLLALQQTRQLDATTQGHEKQTQRILPSQANVASVTNRPK